MKNRSRAQKNSAFPRVSKKNFGAPEAKNQRSKNAFSLLEVIAAIAIFAATASVLLAAISNAFFATKSLSERDEKHEDRREIIRQMLVQAETDATALEDGGDYKTSSGKRVDWDAEASETPQAGLFKVSVTIDWKSGGGKEEFSIYVFRPAWKSQFNNQESILENLQEAFPSDRYDSY